MLAETERVAAIKAATQSIWQQYFNCGKPAYIRNQIAKANSGLIYRVLKQVSLTSPMPEDELRQEGWFGLLGAVEGFEPSLGNDFSSYACPKIRGAMLHAIRAYRPDLHKVPQQWFEHISAIRKAHRILVLTFPNATEADAAEHLGYSVEYYEEIKLGTGRNPAKDIDDCEWFQHDGINPLEYQQKLYEKKSIQVAIASLPKNLRAVVTAVYLQETSIRQIAREQGLKVEEVRARLEEAEGIMREMLVAQGIGIDA